MSDSYTAAVAAAWTDMAPWLTGTATDDFAPQVVGGALAAFSGSDKAMNICTNSFYPEHDFCYEASNLSVAAFGVVAAMPGVVSASDSAMVLGAVRFQNLTVGGYYKGTQKCYTVKSGQKMENNAKCHFNFSYIQASGILQYFLSTTNSTLSISSVAVTDDAGQPPTPALTTTNYDGPSLNMGWVTNQVRGEMPNLFATAAFSALLIGVLQQYLNSGG